MSMSNNKYPSLPYIESLVTSQFRSAILTNYPFLAETKCLPLFRLLDHVLFGQQFDVDSELPLMSWDYCRSLTNRVGRSKNFNSQNLIDDFCGRLKIDLELQPKNSLRRKVRQVLRVDIPDWLKVAVAEMLAGPGSSRDTKLVSGTKSCATEFSENERAATQIGGCQAKSEQVTEILAYLNDLPMESFEGLEANLAEAIDLANQIPEWGKRNRQLSILSKVQSCPKPLYRPVQHSARIYGFGQTFLSCRSEIRDVLASHWTKVDIKQAQLMIVSKLWNIPQLCWFIQSCNGKFWDRLIEQIGLCNVLGAKEALKTAIYSATYGARKHSIVYGNDRDSKGLIDVMSRQKAWRALEHPVFEMLFANREVKADEVRLGASIEDAFGNPLSMFDREGRTNRNKAFSVLCCQAQSYELAILHPVFEYAMTTKATEAPATVTALLHDGLWVDCEECCRQRHLEKIRELVDQKSRELLGTGVLLDIVEPSLRQETEAWSADTRLLAAA